MTDTAPSGALLCDAEGRASTPLDATNANREAMR
jgi:hypothetical protein